MQTQLDINSAKNHRHLAMPGNTPIETLEQLKKICLDRWLARVRHAHLQSAVIRASREAAAIAWLHPFPTLVFPELFEEMARAAVVQASRQKRIMHRSKALLAEAGLGSANCNRQTRDHANRRAECVGMLDTNFASLYSTLGVAAQIGHL